MISIRRFIVGIVVIIGGIIIAAYAYESERNCMSIYEQIRYFFTNNSANLCSTFNSYLIVIGGVIATIGIILGITAFLGRPAANPPAANPLNLPIPPAANPPAANPPAAVNLPNPLIFLIVVIVVGLILTIIFTESLQYVPISDVEEDRDPIQNISVRLVRDSTILVPFRSVLSFYPIHSDITAVIDFRAPVTNITNVKLSGPSNSILTYHGDFYPSKYYKGIFKFPVTSKSGESETSISCKPPINPKLFRCIPAGESTWVFHVTAQHNMLVGNSSNMYNVIISYINSSSWKSNHVSVPFTWPIKMLNLSTLTYFWIVLIGVIISRLTTDYTKLIATTADNKTWMKLYVGIAFSAIIALLIFGNFDQDVPNRGNIIVNISLAFGFGFGFDKALDAGQKFLAN